jgi:alpha-beta hydrolase superfamily lysophospholipase
LYGQSLGGGLVLNHLLRRRPQLAGAVVSSPLLLPAKQPPRWKLRSGRLLQHLWPSFRFATGVPSSALSHDPQVVAAHQTDPLVHRGVSARLGVQMLDAGRWALEHAAELASPVLLLHGEADTVTSCEASREFARRAGPQCTLQTWPGLLHELHGELQRDEVLQAVVAWLRSVSARHNPGPASPRQ